MKINTARWKVKGSITRCTPVRSARDKGRWRMDTYLETSYNKVSWNWEIFSRVYYYRSTAGKLKTRRRFWNGNDFRISKQLSESCLDDIRFNWKFGREWIGSYGKLVWFMYWLNSYNWSFRINTWQYQCEITFRLCHFLELVVFTLIWCNNYYRLCMIWV